MKEFIKELIIQYTPTVLAIISCVKMLLSSKKTVSDVATSIENSQFTKKLRETARAMEEEIQVLTCTRKELELVRQENAALKESLKNIQDETRQDREAMMRCLNSQKEVLIEVVQKNVELEAAVRKGDKNV